MLAAARAHIDGQCKRRKGVGQANRRSIPVRTFADWRDPLPGFFEIDMVDHCGGPKTDGDYVHTLTLTDIATGWTECVAMRMREQVMVIEAFAKVAAELHVCARLIETFACFDSQRFAVRQDAMSQGFPPGFLWGCATSAYQIEGSPLADGAGPNIWHRFVRTPGRIHGGDTGDIAWGRVMPAGRGRINSAGLDFYERLVDELLRAGITPMATLYHWDLPAALDDRGGWLNPDIAHWFADYATAAYKALDDRVPLWATLNEPWVVADGGYMHGVLAPGHRSPHEAAIAAHHLMCAHAQGVHAYRAVGKHQIGLVVNIEPKHLGPQASDADRHARDLADAYMNRQYLDPALLGCYPDELREIFGQAWPDWTDAQVEALKVPIDFLGLNYYTRSVVRHDAAAWPVPAAAVRQPGGIYTETGWELHPDSLTETLLWMHRRYGGLPLYVTENGAAFYDPPSDIDGHIDDPLRVHYLRTHIDAVSAAIAQGADVRGYCAWSLFDNFEWAHGYSKRFGLVHVDFQTLKRTPKASAHYYASVIARHVATHGAAGAQAPA